jgi:hypothetical protein
MAMDLDLATFLVALYVIVDDLSQRHLHSRLRGARGRDGFPLPVAHGARSFTPGWLADITRIGQGGNDRSF